MTIYDYIDYRTYLRKHLSLLPKKGRGIINQWATAMGVHPSLVSQILAETKNLNLEQGHLLSTHIGFSENETEFFLTMILYQRAGNTTLQKFHHKKLWEMKQKANELVEQVKQDRILTEEEKAVFFSHWQYNAIWLYTSIEPGKTFENIVNFFQISRERTKNITDFLVLANLCDNKSGLFKMGPQSLHLERTSPYIFRHHSNWRLRALEVSPHLTSNELMYTGPISISKNDFEKIRNKLTEFIKEFSNTAIESQAEELACLNLDFFLVKNR